MGLEDVRSTRKVGVGQWWDDHVTTPRNSLNFNIFIGLETFDLTQNISNYRDGKSSGLHDRYELRRLGWDSKYSVLIKDRSTLSIYIAFYYASCK